METEGGRVGRREKESDRERERGGGGHVARVDQSRSTS